MTRMRLARAAQEWLPLSMAAGVGLMTLVEQRLPSLSGETLSLLITLWALFVSVKGIERSTWLQYWLHPKTASAPAWVTTTFLAAALLTNDVALTLLLPALIRDSLKHNARLIILVTLAANTGSAVTPFGNPQNIYIMHHYAPALTDFLATTLSFSLGLVPLLLLTALWTPEAPAMTASTDESNKTAHHAGVFLLLFIIVTAITIHLLPSWLALPVLAIAFLSSPDTLRIDYGLLVTIGLAIMLAELIPAEKMHTLLQAPVFWSTAMTSQFIGNVPATILISQHTENWKDLFWGASIGGFGTPIASVANLIAIRLATRGMSSLQSAIFIGQFILLNLLFFLAGTLLYFLWKTY